MIIPLAGQLADRPFQRLSSARRMTAGYEGGSSLMVQCASFEFGLGFARERTYGRTTETAVGFMLPAAMHGG